MSTSREELGRTILQQAKDLRDQVRTNLSSGRFGNDDVQMKAYNQLIEVAAHLFAEDPVLHGQMVIMPDAVLQSYASPLNLVGTSMAPHIPSQRLEAYLTQFINRLQLVLGEPSPDSEPTKTAGEVLQNERKGEFRDIVETLDEFLRKQPEMPAVDARDFGFVADTALRALLVADYVEGQRAFGAGAFKASALLSGGLIEGMLLDLLQQPEIQSRSGYQTATGKFPRIGGSEINWDKVSLSHLIDAALELAVLKEDVGRFAAGARDFRDTVHPRAELRQHIRAHREEAEVLLALVKLMYRQLSKSRGE